MTRDRWQRVKALYEAARAQPESARETWLETACDDATLRAEVASMLEADRRSLPWIDDHVLEATPRSWWEGSETDEVRRIGPYTLVRELGRGGMGTVFLGLRSDGQFEHEVAIKLIKRGMDSDEILDRFRRERQILASLAHPNITRLLDGGMTDGGQPYLVMERIEGEPIDRYCRRHGLSIFQRLDLVRTICEAVHHAHGSLVVHRDIKPGNVLVTEDGVPKLLDFGIAKVLGADRVPDAGTATVGAMPFTADYASPEQLRGRHITTASDIYSLGVLLYELLTGTRPHRSRGNGRVDTARERHTKAPPRPSEVVDDTRTPKQQRVQRRQLAGDLDRIVLKALDHDPRRRYESAAQLAEDLRRHRVGLPVVAQPDALMYRAGKLVRRHRFGAFTAGLLALSMIAGLIATSWQARIARAERERAREEAATAKGVADFLSGMIQETDPFGRTDTETSIRALLDRAAAGIEHKLRSEPRVRAQVLEEIGVALAHNDAFGQARSLLEKSIAIRTEIAGADSPETAATLVHLGALLRRMDELEVAERHLRRALAIQRAKLGNDAIETVDTTGELASVLRERGLFDAALPLARRTLALSRTWFGADSLEVAEASNDLALLRDHTGDLAAAEDLFRDALAIYRAKNGDDHLTVGIALQNLANVLRRRDQPAAAIESMERSLLISRRQVGDESTQVASGLNTLGALYRAVGRFDEARAVYREALDLRTRLLGADHSSVARTALNLGIVLIDLDDLETAEALFEQALATFRRTLDEDHPDVTSTLAWRRHLRTLDRAKNG